MTVLPIGARYYVFTRPIDAGQKCLTIKFQPSIPEWTCERYSDAQDRTKGCVHEDSWRTYVYNIWGEWVQSHYCTGRGSCVVCRTTHFSRQGHFERPHPSWHILSTTNILVSWRHLFKSAKESVLMTSRWLLLLMIVLGAFDHCDDNERTYAALKKKHHANSSILLLLYFEGVTNRIYCNEWSWPISLSGWLSHTCHFFTCLQIPTYPLEHPEEHN